jgi:hypothetical protein
MKSQIYVWDFFAFDMIVNYTDKGWQIITQRAHGLLAAQICARWKTSNQPDRWMDTLIATAEHDDVYNEFENDDLLNPNGGPVNYKMTSFRKEYCERQLEMALTKSRYIALLIAKHIHFVHGQDPTAKAFCKDLADKEKLWLQQTKATQREIDASYDLLEFCDAFSLLICQDLIQPEQRKIEISNGPDKKAYTFFATKDQALLVEEWPFEPDEFKIYYESRTLTDLTYKDVYAFKKAVDLASVDFHELTVRKNHE